jgi:hypothetical protein
MKFEPATPSADKRSTHNATMWISVGIAVGVAIGVALNDIAIGLGIGVALGVGMSSAQKLNNKDSESQK